MPYVIPDSFIENISKLREAYDTCTQVSPDTNSITRASLNFWKKDSSTRNQQIEFIENWLLAQRGYLRPTFSFINETEFYNHVLSLRIIIAACLFIQDQIASVYYVRAASHSLLFQIIDEALQVKGNTLDSRSQGCCFLEAYQCVNDHHNASECNRARGTSFTNIDWEKFKIFLKNKCEALHEQQQAAYPMTSTLMPVCGHVMETIGSKSAYLISDALKKSEAMLSINKSITMAIHAGLLILVRPTGIGLGIVLLAPSFARIISETVCETSLVYLLESSMKRLGVGIGFGIGMTLDLSIQLVGYISTIIQDFISNSQNHFDLTGFDLSTGHRLLNGIELPNARLDLPPAYLENIDPEGFLHIEMKPESMPVINSEERNLVDWKAPSAPFFAQLNLGSIKEQSGSIKERSINPITHEVRGLTSL